MELFCPDCDLRFRKAHDFAIHSKGSKHAAVIEAKRAKEELRKENEWKEQRKDQFREELAPKLQPVFDEYMQSSQATLGPIYVSLCVPVPCASLSESIDCLYQQSRPREHVKERRKCLYKLLFRTIRVLFGPETKLDVYGSIPHKIDDERSDIDMSLQPVKLDVPEAIALDRIAKAIETFVGEEQQQLTVTRVLHARIPVISIRDTLTDTSLDLSMWNVDKMHISEIFSLYFEADPRVRPLVFAVRKFSKVHQINDAFGGFVNSFGWTVAVVCFMMNKKLLPMFDLDSPPPEKKIDVNEANPVGDLLIGFFEWFLNWPYQTHRLSMRVPEGMCEKEAEKFEDYTFVCIERPRTP